MADIISVHSFRGGTGKSNTSANLAALYAMDGLRVGVVDTDIQSPGIHVIFGLDEDEAPYSLNDYLWGRCVETDRSAASLIYYLMTREVPVDPWHILTSDEILLYHAGAPMIQMLLYADGTWEEIVLGPEVDKGQVPQKVIPAGTWMGFVKKDVPEFDWGLYGVMVVPGWHIDDIRMVQDAQELETLRNKFPAAVSRATELGLF
jgi:predicted cupin superfamily sugar epimerase